MCVSAAMPILGFMPDASRPRGNHRNVPPDLRNPPNRNPDQLVSLHASVYDSLAQEEAGKLLKGWSLFISFGWLARRGQKSRGDMGCGGSNEFPRPHYPQFACRQVSTSPQCLLNLGCLLLPVLSVPIPLSSCYVHVTSLTWVSCCWILDCDCKNPSPR